MIWFNLKEMEKRISNNDISEKESFKYYIAIFIVATLIALIIAIRVAVKQNSIQDNPIAKAYTCSLLQTRL